MNDASVAFDTSTHPHRRLDPLAGRWVLVSPHRALRPWQGQQQAPVATPSMEHDASCHLCPGNRRASGVHNPAYRGPYVFANDFPALLPELMPHGGEPVPGTDGLFIAEPARGECRVLCFSHHHGATLPELPPSAVRAVVELWCEQTAELGRRWPWVQVFENKGEMMGCSSPHPHGQVWATDRLPELAQAEDHHQRGWFHGRGRALIDELVQRELAAGERVVCVNDDWLAVVPWWAAWPFETLVMPRRPWRRLPDVNAAGRAALATLIQELTVRYDNLFSCSFPYSMGWHGAPEAAGQEAQADGSAHWRVHAHFYPPLLRSASVRKFMVGYEMLAEAQRDLTPEQAAAALRGVPARHYREAGA